MIGSTPSCNAIVAAAIEEIRTRARWPSVTLHASTVPRYRDACLRISDASTDAGGAISAVTANSPEARIRSRWLPARIARLATSAGIARGSAAGGI